MHIHCRLRDYNTFALLVGKCMLCVFFFFFLEQDLYHAYPVYHFVTAGKDLDDLDHDDLSDERGLVGISPVP